MHALSFRSMLFTISFKTTIRSMLLQFIVSTTCKSVKHFRFWQLLAFSIGISVSGHYGHSPLAFPFLAIIGILHWHFRFDWPSSYGRKTSVNIIIRMKCGFFFDRFWRSKFLKCADGSSLTKTNSHYYRVIKMYIFFGFQV